jgi:hypothetical protein
MESTPEHETDGRRDNRPLNAFFGETHISGAHATVVQVGQVTLPHQIPPPGPARDREDEEARPRTRRIAIATALIGAVGSVTAALITGTIMLWKNGDPVPEFHVVGSCSRVGEILTSRSDGFRPGAAYVTEVRGPDGLPYNGGAQATGTVSSDGGVSWAWMCRASDSPGVYRIRVRDASTGDRSAWTTFRVNVS